MKPADPVGVTTPDHAPDGDGRGAPDDIFACLDLCLTDARSLNARGARMGEITPLVAVDTKLSKQLLAQKQNAGYGWSKLPKTRALMSDQPKPTSERARKRALGKILREALIKRREGYFDLLVSGYSIEQIASHMKKSPSAVRRAVAQALANRRLDAPEDYARLQVARLSKALRCADVSLEAGDLKAIAPLLKVVRELNLYHGVDFRPARPAPTAPPEIAPASPPLALTHAPGAALPELFEDEKSCAKAHSSG